MPKNETRRFERRGDFMVDSGAAERAEESFSRRSARSRGIDKSLRGPIVSDVDFWEKNQSVVDFPGVDTPTDRPRLSAADFPGPRDRAMMASGEPMGDVEPSVDPDPDASLMDVGESLADALIEDVQSQKEQLGTMKDLLAGDRT